MDSPAMEMEFTPVLSASDQQQPALSVSGGNNENSCLFIGRLAFDCRTRELEDLFGKYGRITRCDIKKGYAFVEFEDARDATDAIKYLDGTRFLGLNITVERTKNERRVATNPDGTKNRECFKCGKPGHYARECDNGERRGGVERGYNNRDSRDRRDYHRDSRDSRDSRSYRGSRQRSTSRTRRPRSRSPVSSRRRSITPIGSEKKRGSVSPRRNDRSRSPYPRRDYSRSISPRR